jgi:hypothetical protein
MRKLIGLGCGLLLLSLPVSGSVVQGLLNDDEPYIVRGDADSLYKYSGMVVPPYFGKRRSNPYE